MYNKEGKKAKLINILIGVIAIFIIAFIVIWLVNNKSTNSSTNVESFNTSLQALQETAKEYFAGNLPDEIGDSNQVPIQELYDIGAIEEITYGKTTCDPEESYISITKTTANEYRVKSNLICGDKTDNIVEKIKSNTVVKDENDNTIVDEEKDGVDLDVTENKNDSEPIDPKKDNVTSSDGKTPDSTVNCTGPNCEFIQIPTQCTVTYEYQYVKRSMSCPTGFNIASGKCVKYGDETTNPNAIFTEETTKVVDAKKNPGEPYKVYVDPIVKRENGSYSCNSGELVGEYCYSYTEKKTSTSSECPYGYNKIGNYCYKYTDRTTTQSSSCPDGYTRNGNYCYKYANKNTNYSSSCPNGYTPNGNYCYKYANKTTSSSCPNGTTPTSDGRCLKTVSAVRSYTPWGNPSRTYSTNKYEAPYTYELTRKVLIGSKTIGKTKVYTYAIYNRSPYYNCAQGTLSGTKCLVYTSPTTTTSSCPNGYQDGGSSCYIRVNKTTTSSSSCPNGYQDGGGNTCYIRTNLQTTTSGSCPAGYKDTGSTCYIKTNLNTSTTKYCPAGYEEKNDNECYKKTPATYKNGNIFYDCPEDTTKTGTGANTKCYKMETSEDEYYCENTSATLKDKLCYIKVPAQFKENTCGYGYTLGADNLCHKSSEETATPIWSDVDYIYSKADYVPGYQKTGRGNFVQTCVRIEEPKTIHYK